MTTAEDQTMLDNINAAINAILTGAQHFAIGDKQVTRADLEVLFKQREMFEGRIARSGRGGSVRGVTIHHG